MTNENKFEEGQKQGKKAPNENPENKLALADLDERARYFASGNLDIWAIKHINEEYSK
jgi:hypothetical protein